MGLRHPFRDDHTMLVILFCSFVCVYMYVCINVSFASTLKMSMQTDQGNISTLQNKKKLIPPPKRNWLPKSTYWENHSKHKLSLKSLYSKKNFCYLDKCTAVFFFFQNQKSLQSRLLVQKRNFWVEKNTWEIHTDTHTHTYVGVHTHTWIYTFWTSISRVGFRI